MSKAVRVLTLLMLLMILIAPLPPVTQAAPIPCDTALFDSAVFGAVHDGNIVFSGGLVVHYRLTDGNITLNYHRYGGTQNVTEIIEVYRRDRLKANGINGTWLMCTGGNNWKNVILAHNPPK